MRSEYIYLVIFLLAVLHTFSTKAFEKIAHKSKNHSGLWNLLAEIEVVFGFWSAILLLLIYYFEGGIQALNYIDSRSFTEPLFIFAIMVVAGTKQILQFVTAIIKKVSKILPLKEMQSIYFITLFLVPLFGSLITEPGAMTLAALILRELFYSQKISKNLKYATLGVLFVNISVGGVLTPFAAPPVLMVAGKWNWDLYFMMSNFGWRAILIVLVNSILVSFIYKSELNKISEKKISEFSSYSNGSILVNLLFLFGIVYFSHHPVIFLSLLLFFIGITTAYQLNQNKLLIREGLLVAFFLAGLVVLGGKQQWWLQYILSILTVDQIYYCAIALTSIADNAAITYLASLVNGLTDEFKYAIVSGAITGGGLTVIANAPNPAGFSLLKNNFEDNSISAVGLFLSALIPTFVAVVFFKFI
ncbi:MAG: putative Na+/H+ antiporter [Bacteroidetes bacterium]|nr:putative Na+/H+ antiporter [Bacteroidota bacterium]